MMNAKEAIRKSRDAVGDTRKQFGFRLGLTEHSIKRLESGRMSLGLRTAIKLSNLTGRNFVAFVGPYGTKFGILTERAIEIVIRHECESVAARLRKKYGQ